MKNRFDVELEVATDLSPLELGSKIEQAVREALEAVGHSLIVSSKRLQKKMILFLTHFVDAETTLDALDCEPYKELIPFLIEIVA